MQQIETNFNEHDEVSFVVTDLFLLELSLIWNDPHR